MTAWMATMSGSIMAQIGDRHVPFDVMFKAVIGCAVAGILVVGAPLAFVDAGAHVEFALQVIAGLGGAILGAYVTTRAARNASPQR